MNDNEPKFFDPETGAELPRVPEGAATIPKDTPYGFIRPDGTRGWQDGGARYTFNQLRDHIYFTREPIAPPKPPLPTEPGYYLDKDGSLWQLDALSTWWSAVKVVSFTSQGVERFAPFVPVTIVPTETWERLRVFDPEVKLDRVDSEGRVWRYSKDFDGWESENGVRYYRLAVVDTNFGPLRFADEVSSDE